MVGIWIGIIGPIDNGIDKIEIAVDTYQTLLGETSKMS